MSDMEALFFQGQSPPRWDVFSKAVQMVGRSDLAVVETGVSHDYCNGLSTAFWSSCIEVSSVNSIDLGRSGLEGMEKKLGRPLEKISLSIGHSVSVISSLPNRSVDILYLDSDVDPELMLYEAMAGLSKLRFPAAIVADDTDSKGPLLMDFLGGKRMPCKFPPYGGWKGNFDVSVEKFRPPGTFGLMIGLVRGFLGFEAA